MSIGERFGANLKRCRESRDVSQEDLGFAAGLHRTEVGMLERGVRLPRIDTFVKLCGTLDAEPNELLRGIAWIEAAAIPGHFLIDEEIEP